MADQEAPGQDWRSVETRAADHVALGTARKRAAEPGRGREAKRPEEIPSRGWMDLIWRVIGSIPRHAYSEHSLSGQCRDCVLECQLRRCRALRRAQQGAGETLAR